MKGFATVTGRWLTRATFAFVLLSAGYPAEISRAGGSDPDRVVLRAWGVPGSSEFDVNTLARRSILRAFRERHPHIHPAPATGITIAGRAMDMAPLMQIAGDIAPDVMYVNFRQSHTYISNRFLYPLDKYIERSLGMDIPEGHLLDNAAYLDRLKESEAYEREIGSRVPEQLWPIIRRRSPYGADSPWLKEFGAAPAEEHYHVFAWPVGPVAAALFFDRALFADHDLPERVPEDWEEMLAWARALHHPRGNQFGFRLPLSELGYSTVNFVYSMGGRLMDRDDDGEWKLVFDSEEAVEAYAFVARMFLEEFTNAYGTFEGCVFTGDLAAGLPVRTGMFFSYLDEQFFAQDPERFGLGPVPRGPTGHRGSEFNSRMTGIYAGLEGPEHSRKRDAAWEYIRFYDGPEARRERARVFVENGMGHFLRPSLLREAGFGHYADRVPTDWEDALHTAMEEGVPEPYGKNCQMVYRYVSAAINQIRVDAQVRRAIRAGDDAGVRDRIRVILRDAAERGNRKMLDRMPPDLLRTRKRAAMAVTSGILVLFLLLLRHVFKAFRRPDPMGRGGWMFSRLKWAYLLMAPAIASIALWHYIPLLRGTAMAFQDYNVRGFSEWIGMENFARVLFDEEFWFAMWVTVKYAFFFILFGFWTPIALAFLLTEIPRGSVFFRVVYYLPAMLTGVVAMFLWRGFFSAYGAVSQVINAFRALASLLPFVDLPPLHVNWLDHPQFALLCILAPVIWAGIGPGCLIYLAALKTIPEELYEAADIDGAGLWAKVFRIAIPNIRGLILINFIGVLVAQMQGNAAFVLAMTGGGPHTPYGQTEVAGLHIFFQAFGYLRFGIATSMAWILGSFLIGFTVLRLKRLSNMEFKTAS